MDHASKVFMMRDELQRWKDEKELIVMFTDAYDVILYERPREIVRKFKRLNASVVFGAEYFCNPDSSKAELFPEVKENERRFLNSGCYIGYVNEVYSIISYIANQFQSNHIDGSKCYYAADSDKNSIGLFNTPYQLQRRAF